MMIRRERERESTCILLTTHRQVQYNIKAKSMRDPKESERIAIVVEIS